LNTLIVSLKLQYFKFWLQCTVYDLNCSKCEVIRGHQLFNRSGAIGGGIASCVKTPAPALPKWSGSLQLRIQKICSIYHKIIFIYKKDLLCVRGNPNVHCPCWETAPLVPPGQWHLNFTFLRGKLAKKNLCCLP
jgi:hypothetical protein